MEQQHLYQCRKNECDSKFFIYFKSAQRQTPSVSDKRSGSFSEVINSTASMDVKA